MATMLKPDVRIGRDIDRLYALDQQRVQAQKHVDDLKKQYNELETDLLNRIPKAQLEGALGRTAMAKITRSVVPQCADWDKLWAHVKKTGEFDLMQKRLSTEACRARWENKKSIPGVEQFTVVKLSVTKRK